jgi:hypothetical protein
MINSYGAVHDPQKKFKSRSAAGLLIKMAGPASSHPTRDPRTNRRWRHGLEGQPNAPSSRKRERATRCVGEISGASSEHEVRKTDRAFNCRSQQARSASDRSRLALRWNIRSRVVSCAYGSAARADHISLARNSFLNFHTIGEKPWRRIRQ